MNDGRRRLTVRLYPTTTGKVIHNITNKSISNKPYPQLTKNDALKSIKKFHEREQRRLEEKKNGVSKNDRTGKARFCREHNTGDVLGTVTNMYINEQDDWIWAEIRSKRNTAHLLNDDIFNKNIKGVSMGYYLEDATRDYKEIEEISLVKHPDFLNSRIKVVHSQTSFLPIAHIMDSSNLTPESSLSSSSNLSDDPIEDSFSASDFAKLPQEDQDAFIKRSIELERQEEAKRALNAEKESEQALESVANKYMPGVSALVNVLDTSDDKKSEVGDKLMHAAVTNELFGNAVKMAEEAIAKEKSRVSELELANKELLQKISSMKNDAKSSARQNSGFGISQPIKVNHSMSQNLFSIMNRKRSANDITPSATPSQQEPSMEPPVKVAHSASSSSSSKPFLPAGFDYVEPQSGFSLAPLFMQQQNSSDSAEHRVMVTHSATSGSSSNPSFIQYDPNNINRTTISLLHQVLENKRDFGDAWNVDMLQNSLLVKNPKAFCQIIGEKNARGHHRTNRDEGVFGYNSDRFNHIFVDPNNPSINPYHRKDQAYISKYRVSSDEYGTRDFSLI